MTQNSFKLVKEKNFPDTFVAIIHIVSFFLSVTIIKRHGSGAEKFKKRRLMIIFIFSNITVIVVPIKIKWEMLFSAFLYAKIPLETLSTVEMEDMDTEENAPPDQYGVLHKELEILVKESQVQCNIRLLVIYNNKV